MLRSAASPSARWLVSAIALALALSAAPTLANTAAASDPDQRRIGLPGEAVFGARVEPTPGMSPRQSVEALEAELGTPLPLVSEYLDWDDSFPSSYQQWLINSGHRLVLLVKLKRNDGSRPLWSKLAAAQPGDRLYRELLAWAESIRDVGEPVYFVFHKEPNEFPNRANGSAPAYKDAWHRVAEVFDAAGATNAQLVFALAGSIYARPLSVETWYPGDDVVDVIAASGVNGDCSATRCNWRSQEQIMSKMVAWSASHVAQSIAVIEGATVEDPNKPLRKRNWIDDAHAYLGGDFVDRVAFFSYWSSSAGTDFRLTTSPKAVAAGARWASDPVWGADPN